MKIKVIGAGGIGLSLLPTLARFVNFDREKFPQPDIHIIDGDAYEDKNRPRQAFREVGNKATVTAESMRGDYPRVSFWDHPVFVDDNNLVRHIREGDFVFLCVDNHATRKMVGQRVSELNDCTVISGGNDLVDGNVIIHIRRDGKDITPGITDPNYHDDIINSRDLHPAQSGQAGFCQAQAQSTPQILIVNNMIASIMLQAFYNLTDPESFAKIMANPVEHGEVFASMATMKANPAPRFVQS